MGLKPSTGISITLLNMPPVAPEPRFFENLVGDARNMALEDKSFDVVFSNSVIEHVGDLEDQRRMAQEVVRVGRRYFVQTPNKFFPIEPHFLVPFFQFLPLASRVWLLRRFRLGWISRMPDARLARNMVESIRLLTRSELHELFPRAQLYEERLIGMAKSFVALDGWEGGR
jgi:2-polyprenyl-3-methyl-5-hydroxy-6-metoxy-1,4-benzoquinol methylase